MSVLPVCVTWPKYRYPSLLFAGPPLSFFVSDAFLDHTPDLRFPRNRSFDNLTWMTQAKEFK